MKHFKLIKTSQFTGNFSREAIQATKYFKLDMIRLAKKKSKFFETSYPKDKIMKFSCYFIAQIIFSQQAIPAMTL